MKPRAHVCLRKHRGASLARVMHETPWRDRGDGRATGQPQGLGPEAYWFSTSQGARPEDARLPARRAYSSKRRAARSAVAAGESCIMRARRARGGGAGEAVTYARTHQLSFVNLPVLGWRAPSRRRSYPAILRFSPAQCGSMPVTGFVNALELTAALSAFFSSVPACLPAILSWYRSCFDLSPTQFRYP